MLGGLKMKRNKIISVLLCFILCAGIFCGCKKQEPAVTPEKPDVKETDSVNLPNTFPLQLRFSTGVGGWETYITIKEDGSFVGNYHDSEFGSTGENYNGTIYVCEFSGKFEFVEQLNDYSYSMKLIEITTADEENTEWIEDGIRYVASIPYGLESGTEFILYTPETPVDGLSKYFLSWWSYRYGYDEEPPKTLSLYGLCNVETGYGFFSLE